MVKTNFGIAWLALGSQEVPMKGNVAPADGPPFFSIFILNILIEHPCRRPKYTQAQPHIERLKMSGLVSRMSLFRMTKNNPSDCVVPSQASRWRPKSKCDTITKSKGPMSIFPAVPFASGPWVPRAENRLKVGKRIRKRGETESKEAEEQVAGVCSTNNSPSVDHASERRKRLGPALRKAQGRLSKLWKRKGQQDFTTTNTETSSPLASDDECCKSNNSNGDAAPEEQLSMSQRDDGEPLSSSQNASMRTRLMRPLYDLQNRHFVRPYSALDPSEEGVKVQLASSDEESDDLLHESIPAIEVAPQFNPRPLITELRAADENESFSMLDTESTACLEPSVAELSVGVDEEERAWEPPKPRKRKHRKPKHGDDSVLIGMIITFDPTSELLDMGTKPQCIKRTMLSRLQKNEEYQGCLLGNRTEEEESSTEETPSVSDILGFHLDTFALPKIDTSVEEPECPFPSETTGVEEEEVVFSSGVRGLNQVPNPADDSFEAEDWEEEIEIVFYSDDDLSSDDSSSKCSKHTDCRSDTSDGSALPLEWMLPTASRQLPVKLIDESFEVMRDETPEYEWFLPEHLDVQPIKEHTPMALFGDLASQKAKISLTPSTAGETFSFQNQSSFDGSEGNTSGEVLSVGSAPSEAVQSLLELCQSDASSVEKRLSRIFVSQKSLSLLWGESAWVDSG
jgi:hypothetical protein